MQFYINKVKRFTYFNENNVCKNTDSEHQVKYFISYKGENV